MSGQEGVSFLIMVGGFALTVGAIIWNGGRQSKSLEDATTTLSAALNGRIDVVAQSVLATRELMSLQYTQLTARVADVSVEVLRVRDDRHDLTGKVMQHTGLLGEQQKQLVALEVRVKQIEQQSA